MVNKKSGVTAFFDFITNFWDVLLLGIIFSYLLISLRNNSEVLINLILLFTTAFLVEVHYISRFGVLPNVLVVIFILKDNWINVPQIIQIYAIIGGILGVILFSMGIKNTSVPNFIYSIIYVFYGLKTIMSLYIAYLIIGDFDTNFGIVFIVILITIWYLGVVRFDNKSPLEAF